MKYFVHCFCVFFFLSLSGELVNGENPEKPSATHAVNYVEDVKPLLRERCYACHGGLKQESDLRVDTVDLMLQGGLSGPVITPGDAEDSYLLERVAADDPAYRMPPEHEGEPFSEEEIALLKRWISAGATAPADEKPEADPRDHWAFQKIIRPEVPAIDSPWIRNSIDAFVARRHRQQGLSPQSEASALQLQRRLYLDLIGMPPDSDELQQFMARDHEDDFYEETVDRLLEDPRYGERWGRHWMDIWRYSDWWGLGKQLRNSQKQIWHWRDWIIESLNQDTPYDEMLRQMLAADEYYPEDLDKLRATGYLARNFNLFNRDSWMDETVEHFSKGILGLTMNCAKCHDHKYDPISHSEYYALRAFFEPYHVRKDLVPGELDFTKNSIPRAFDALLDAPTYRYIRGSEANPDKSKVIRPDVPEILYPQELNIEPVQLPPVASQPERRKWVFDAYLERERKNVEDAKEAVTAAHDRLLEAQQRKNDVPEQPDPLLSDNFADFDADHWLKMSGDWQHSSGHMKVRSDEKARLRYVGEMPRDFEVTMRFRIKPGGRYQSIGIRFDVADAGTQQIVYVSGGGDKIQAAYDEGQGWRYPGGQAIHKQPVSEDEDYVLRVETRGQIVVAFLNGKQVIEWESPLKRTPGALEVFCFSGAAEFHEVTIENASVETLEEALIDAQHQVDLATAKLKLAEARHESVFQRAAAMRAQWNGKNEVAKEQAIRAEQGVKVAEIQCDLLELQHQLSTTADGERQSIEKNLEKVHDELRSAEAKRTAPIEDDASFTPLIAAKWSSTRFRHSGKDDPTLEFPSQSTGRRKALADWMTSRDNPLTARVAVNHIWNRHFGKPLVATVFDFGRNGSPPSHPELLDWLAVELMENDWSMKHLHRLILNSATYRMGSNQSGTDTNNQIDPENRFLWHRDPIRLESQVIRDSVLALSGELDLTMGGPPVPPAKQESSKRRSLYFFHSNNDRNLFLTMFDEANVKECYRREESIVPQQALALSNSKLILEAAPKIAEQIDSQDKLTDKEFIEEAFVRILGMTPHREEMEASLNALADWKAMTEDSPRSPRAHLVWVLLNHNDFVTLR